MYSDVEMAEYLQPKNSQLTVDGKQRLFSVRNCMTDIPNNFPKTKTRIMCWCGEPEDMAHIYNCELLNDGVK